MRIPYIGNDEIRQIADEFLVKNYPSLKTPIPIETIVEENLGIFIFPFKKLETNCFVDGFISGDFKTISIDEFVYEKQENRARFTLAHEVGHLILHKDLYEKEKIKDTKQFIDFQNAISDKDWKRLEIQAGFFAEDILFPQEIFISTVKKAVESMGGIEKIVDTEDIATIVGMLEDEFFVSGRCAYNKLRRDFKSLIDLAEANFPF